MNAFKLLLVCGLLAVAAVALADEPYDAMMELNRIRASKGLRPFIRDEGLTRGAMSAAKFRADRLIKGHTRPAGSDFGFLPRGVSADATGAGGCAPFWGFMACCDDENWRFAGAATCKGADGRLYHHLFVSNRQTSLNRPPRNPAHRRPEPARLDGATGKPAVRRRGESALLFELRTYPDLGPGDFPIIPAGD